MIDKPIVLLDKIIYPKSLEEIIKEQLKKEEMYALFFSKSFIRLLVINYMDEEKLDDACLEIQNIFKQEVEKTLLISIDDDEARIWLKSIYEQISNGIPEKAFYDWFMKLAFCCRQISIPLEYNGSDKKGFGPCSMIKSYKFSNGVYSNYLFFSSDGSLLNEITINELIKKADKEIQEKISKGSKPKKQPNKRKPIDSRLRHECFKRDNYTCKECGITNKDSVLHCDHILPVSQGGTDELSNLQTLCDKCNLAKSDKKWKAGDNGNKVN